MLEAYSTAVAVGELGNIPFENVTIKKGCTVELSGPATIQFNKCGIYMVSCDATASASTTIQLYKNGIEQPQAQSTGTTLSFLTLVQVPENNTCCPCSSPTICQIVSTEGVTFDSVNIVVTKVV